MMNRNHALVFSGLIIIAPRNFDPDCDSHFDLGAIQKFIKKNIVDFCSAQANGRLGLLAAEVSFLQGQVRT